MLIKYLSLFCGCGGFDLGMNSEAFECVAAFDIDVNVVNVFNANIANVAHVQDLSKETTKSFPAPEVIISGAPCQGFSTAGKRMLNDPRNKLYIRAIDFVEQIKPRVFVAENVAGIMAGEHKKRYMDGAIARLKNLGYRTFVSVIDCRDLGMAQMRKRTILFAWNTARALTFPEKKESSQTIRDALKDMSDELPNHCTKDCKTIGLHEKIAQQILPGQKLCNVRGGTTSVHTWDIPEIFGETTPEEKQVLNAILLLRRRLRKRDYGDADPVSLHDLEEFTHIPPEKIVESLLKKMYIRDINGMIDLCNTYNGIYRRLEWDQPSLTVDTRFGSPRLFLHPTENRGYTVREAARLQGFPDSFVFSGSIHAQYKMVGNAVPPPLGKYIADVIGGLYE